MAPSAVNTAVEAPTALCSGGPESPSARFASAPPLTVRSHARPAPRWRAASQPNQIPAPRLATRCGASRCSVSAVHARHHCPACTRAQSSTPRSKASSRTRPAEIADATPMSVAAYRRHPTHACGYRRGGGGWGGGARFSASYCASCRRASAASRASTCSRNSPYPCTTAPAMPTAISTSRRSSQRLRRGERYTVTGGSTLMAAAGGTRALRALPAQVREREQLADDIPDELVECPARAPQPQRARQVQLDAAAVRCPQIGRRRHDLESRAGKLLHRAPLVIAARDQDDVRDAIRAQQPRGISRVLEGIARLPVDPAGADTEVARQAGAHRQRLRPRPGDQQRQSRAPREERAVGDALEQLRADHR